MYTLSILSIWLSFSACEDEKIVDNEVDNNSTSVSAEATTIKYHFAFITGQANIIYENGDVVIGVLLSKNENPSLDKDQIFRIKEIDNDNKYSILVDSLEDNTKYYYCPFITQNGMTKKGVIKSFTTLSAEFIVITGDMDSLTYAVKSNVLLEENSYRTLELGVCYDTASVPTIKHHIVMIDTLDAQNNYTLTLNLHDIPIGDINYRAFVKIDGYLHYGNLKSTIKKTKTPEAVDLGLGVLWATFNVGAANPEDYGNYYSWGEIETKNDYSWASYKFANGSQHTLNKYNSNSSCGTVDYNSILDLEDDVAHEQWGDKWRVPTQFEIQQLIDNCTWTWTTLNGVNGYKVTSNKNGYTDNYIFLPAAGAQDNLEISETETTGHYWSSTLYKDEPNTASSIKFNQGSYLCENSDRCKGFTIRPVMGENDEEQKIIRIDSTTIRTLSYIADSTLIVIQSNNDWQASVDEGCEWCNISKKNGMSGRDTIKVYASENITTTPRQTAITVESGNVTIIFKVNQKAGEEWYEIPYWDRTALQRMGFHGKIEKMTIINNRHPNESTIYTFDSKGNMLTHQSIDQNFDRYDTTRTYTYDEYNHRLSCTVKADFNDEVVRKWRYEYENTGKYVAYSDNGWNDPNPLAEDMEGMILPDLSAVYKTWTEYGIEFHEDRKYSFTDDSRLDINISRWKIVQGEHIDINEETVRIAYQYNNASKLALPYTSRGKVTNSTYYANGMLKMMQTTKEKYQFLDNVQRMVTVSYSYIGDQNESHDIDSYDCDYNSNRDCERQILYTALTGITKERYLQYQYDEQHNWTVYYMTEKYLPPYREPIESATRREITYYR